jgi:HAD superfamily hydrolase (TIGR01549 family)
MTRAATVRAVLFDLDDTLFDHRGCARDALEAVQASHPCFREMAFTELEQAHARFLEELHQEVMTGRVQLDAARNERFRRLFAAAGVTAADSLARRAASTYRERYTAARRAVAGAAALLRLVRARARVGIVSNNLLEEQREKLRVCGLDGFIDELVVSEEAGASKPDPAIFLLALERLGCPAGNAVMVGDSWPADIAGARACGIRAIWLNPHHEPAPDGEASVSQLEALEPPEVVIRMIFDAHRD